MDDSFFLLNTKRALYTAKDLLIFGYIREYCKLIDHEMATNDIISLLITWTHLVPYLEEYSRYGQYYLYQSKFKNNKHYVAPKYESFEQEVEHLIGSKSETNNMKSRALLTLSKMRTFCKTYDQDKCFNKYGIRLKAIDHKNYNDRFDIKPGKTITIDHIIALKICFNYNDYYTKARPTFQTQLTAKEINNPEELKTLHQEYAHISKYIESAVHLYGAKLCDYTKINGNRLYNGLTGDSIPHFGAFWSGPVSSTGTLEVATLVASAGNNNNVVVELKESDQQDPEWPVMYISAAQMLSNYPEEEEYLLWGAHINVVDIVYNGTTLNLTKYVSALRLMELICNDCLEIDESIKELLSDKTQRILTELIQWKYVDDKEDDTRLQKLIQQDEDITFTTDITFVAKICNRLFDNLKGTKKIWVNPNFKLNENLVEALKEITN